MANKFYIFEPSEWMDCHECDSLKEVIDKLVTDKFYYPEAIVFGTLLNLEMIEKFVALQKDKVEI